MRTVDTPSQLLPSAAFPPFLADLLRGVAATLPLAEDEATIAALAIADGQPRQAWQLLAPLMSNRPADPLLWQLAFETLTLLAEADELERLVTAYAETFGEIPPFAQSAQERIAELKASSRWQRWPGTLSAEAAAALAASWSKAPGGELASDVSQVTTVTPEAAPLLIEALGQWVKKGGKLLWRGLSDLLNRYPGQNLLATASELQLAILWHRAAGHTDQAEALALEHALRFDTTPPEWCLTAAGTAETQTVGRTAATTSKATVDLVLPDGITPPHTEALIHRLERKAEAGQRLSIDAARVRQWPVIELLTLGFALRRLPHRPRGEEPRLLLCHHAPRWLQQVIPSVGLAPWVEFVDNNGS